VPLSKFPEDLRVYEHLLWLQMPDTVIGVGTQWGGSALWFRDRLRTLRDYGRIERDPLVVTIDLRQEGARDKHIDELRVSEDWPRGVLPALRDWLATEAGREFVVRRDLELYGVSCHPHGFLQRISSAG
jgi:cephalosporin hydroxylase